MGLEINDMLSHLRAYDEPERDGFRLVHGMDAGLFFPPGADRESCRARPFFVWTPTTDGAWQCEVDAVESSQRRPDSESERQAPDRPVRTRYVPAPPDGRPRGVSLKF